MEDLYLAHHGIKGMKWGVRRYENYDGTLTSAGKKRYHGPFAKFRERRAIKKAERKQKKADKFEVRTHMNTAREKRNWKLNSDEMQSLMDSYENDMNSEKMRLLRAEAKLKTREYNDAIERYNQAEQDVEDAKKDPDSIRPGFTDLTTRRLYKWGTREAMNKIGEESALADKAYEDEYDRIDKQYVDKFKDLVVKEIYPDDIKRGKELMDKYNMWDEYIRPANQMRRDYARDY